MEESKHEQGDISDSRPWINKNLFVKINKKYQHEMLRRRWDTTL